MLSAIILFLNIGTQEMMLIVFVALLLFGGKKLPELARGLGRGIREFKDASESIKRDISDQINNFEKDLEVKIDEPKQLEQHAATAALPVSAAATTYDFDPDVAPDDYYEDSYLADQEAKKKQAAEASAPSAVTIHTEQNHIPEDKGSKEA